MATLPDSNGPVLVVERDVHIRHILTTTLHRRGYSTVETEDGAAALVLAAERSPVMIVTELYVPGNGEDSVLASVKSDPRLQHIPVLVYTSHASSADVAEALALGANGFLTKPQPLAAFMEEIHRIAGRPPVRAPLETGVTGVASALRSGRLPFSSEATVPTTP